ncbi:hypothetical protein V8E51_006963 [Hyaloscypha variabilis]
MRMRAFFAMFRSLSLCLWEGEARSQTRLRVVSRDFSHAAKFMAFRSALCCRFLKCLLRGLPSGFHISCMIGRMPQRLSRQRRVLLDFFFVSHVDWHYYLRIVALFLVRLLVVLWISLLRALLMFLASRAQQPGKSERKKSFTCGYPPRLVWLPHKKKTWRPRLTPAAYHLPRTKKQSACNSPPPRCASFPLHLPRVLSFCSNSTPAVVFLATG